MESQVDTTNPILDAAKAGDVRLLKPSSRSSAELYKLSPEDAAFFKAQTGIDNDEALKEHILAVQERAYKVRHSHQLIPNTGLHGKLTIGRPTSLHSVVHISPVSLVS